MSDFIPSCPYHPNKQLEPVESAPNWFICTVLVPGADNADGESTMVACGHQVSLTPKERARIKLMAQERAKKAMAAAASAPVPPAEPDPAT